MSEIEQYAEAAKVGIPLATKALALLGIRRKGNQTQQNLREDVDAIKELQDSGVPVAYYKGPAIEVEAFDRASDAETERLAVNTLNTMSKAYSPSDWENVDSDELNPEFLRRWTFEASNVSDETLQVLWASLLKGELENPGSVSNDTMSIARDMNKARAEEFQILCSTACYYPNGTPSLVISCGSPGANSLSDFGLSFSVLTRLAHHRLTVGVVDTNITIHNSQLGSGLLLVHQGTQWIIRSSTPPDQSPDGQTINGILFTPAGDELSRVVERIPTPKYTAAMLQYMGEQHWNMDPSL